jgi:hypothetical protein
MDVESAVSSSETTVSEKIFGRAKRCIALIAFAVVLVLEIHIFYFTASGSSSSNNSSVRGTEVVLSEEQWNQVEELLNSRRG